MWDSRIYNDVSELLGRPGVVLVPTYVDAGYAPRQSPFGIALGLFCTFWSAVIGRSAAAYAIRFHALARF